MLRHQHYSVNLLRPEKHPRTPGAAVFATQAKHQVTDRKETLPVNLATIEAVLRQFPWLLSDNTITMAGEYKIRLESIAQPVQDNPRKVPIAIRDQVRQKLEELEEQGII